MPDEKVNPDPSGNRPLPDPPRRPEDVGNMNIYALLVGINDYQGGSISKLSGCVQDVEMVAGFLQERYGDRLKLRTLTDTEATYTNIVKAFDEHLVNGGGTGNDSFWFHFSGHGSEQFTAEQFFTPKDANGKALPSLAPNGKDQTLVCYNPGGATDGIFLADKELAVLLHKIHEKARSIGRKKPHVLITLDCCHSGSGTRAEPGGIKVRKFDYLSDHKNRNSLDNPSGAVRKLDTYYNGWYTQNGAAQDQSNLRVPHSQHLLISGCTNLELASDGDEGGAFTSSLIQALRTTAGEPINYVDLFTQTRAKAHAIAQKRRNKQTPQFEPVGNFNPYTAVLEGWGLGGPGKYEVKIMNGRWYVRAGAVNGLRLPEGTEEKTQLLIYKAQGEELVGNAQVSVVGVQDSRLELLKAVKPDANGALAPSEQPLVLDPNVLYVAEIYTLPAAPQYILVQGDEGAVNALLEQWDKQADKDSVNLKNLNIIAVTGDDAPEKPEVAVEARQVEKDGALKNTYVFTNLLSGKRWHTIGAGVDNPVEVAKESLDKIVRWRRMLALENPGSKLQNSYELKLLTGTMQDYLAAGQPDPAEDRGAFLNMMKIHAAEAGDLVLQCSPEDFFDMGKESIPYLFRIQTKKADEDLYFYLFGLMEDCAIDVHPPGELHLEKTIADQENDFGNDVGVLQINAAEQEAHFWFKLFVTKQPIEVQALTQAGFSATRSFVRFRLSGDTEDWHCTTLKVTVRRA